MRFINWPTFSFDGAKWSEKFRQEQQEKPRDKKNPATTSRGFQLTAVEDLRALGAVSRTINY
jgi:hypothetical protein